MLKNEEIAKLVVNIKNINENLKSNIWIKRYNNYLAYRSIEKELEEIKLDVQKYSTWEGVKYKELSYQLTNKIKIKQNELSLIDEYKDSPIGKMIKPKDTETIPFISNPLILLKLIHLFKNLR